MASIDGIFQKLLLILLLFLVTKFIPLASNIVD